MQLYLEPIKISVLTFPILSFLLAIPFSIYNYKKYGYINKWRVFVLFTFILYLLTAYYLVILPLPQSRDVKSFQKPGTVHYNLKAFQFIKDISEETNVDIKNVRTYPRLLRERAFLQAVFNLLLTLPFGVYLKYYFKKNLKEIIVYSFLLSLFFEITQLTALYGIYNAPYRLFDIDDLFLNTLGGIIGYLLAPIFEFFFPNIDSLDTGKYDQFIKVSYVRRFIAFIIDVNLIKLISSFFIGNNINFIIFVLYFLIVLTLTKGKTLGLSLTNLILVAEEDELNLLKLLKRYVYIYIVYIGMPGLIRSLNAKIGYLSINRNEIIFYLLILFFIVLITSIILFLNILISILKKERFFYEKYSKTYIKVDKTN